jgi:hypothetical protein
MMKSFVRLSLLVMALAVLWIAPVSAHGGQEVGEYEVVFGWQVEPAYAGVFNGPEIYIRPHGHGHDSSDEHGEEANFLEGVDVNLKAEVTFGPETTTVTFKAAWGEVGHYVADLVPTLPGDYVFRITGNIGDAEVDLVFDSADGEFSSVLPSADILFPSASSIEARLAALEARIAELEAALAALSE